MAHDVGLREVAALSGVSISTASRALSGSSRISTRTRTRVQRAATRLGYSPNVNARGLRTKRSKLVGLIVPFLDSPTFTRLASEVQANLRAAGYEILLSVTDSDEQATRASLDILQSHQAAGALLVGSQMHPPFDVSRWRMPIVYMFNDPLGDTSDSVRPADFDEVTEATDYLLDLGHRRIGFIGGPFATMVEAFTLAHQRRGTEFDPALLYIGRFSPETGVAGVDKLLSLENPPTALILSSYSFWKGALPRLSELGVSIPDDLSVICREESDFLDWWRPAMTTMPVDIPAIAALATDRLLYHLDNPKAQSEPGGRYTVRARLAVRESCAPPS